jgi:hypothetical protein
VGQLGKLRPIGNRPRVCSAPGERVDNPGQDGIQDAILPHKAAHRPTSSLVAQNSSWTSKSMQSMKAQAKGLLHKSGQAFQHRLAQERRRQQSLRKDEIMKLANVELRSQGLLGGLADLE